MAERQQSRGKSNSSVPFLAAAGLAVLGILLVTKHVRDNENRLRRELGRDPIWVLQATGAVREGDALSVSDLGFRRVTKEEQPWSTIKFDNPDRGGENRRIYDDLLASLSGRVVNRNVSMGDLVLWTDIDHNRPETLSEILQAGRRGVAVEVDRHSLLGGLLQPNDRVDVLATYDAGIAIMGGGARGERSQDVSKTVVVLEDVTVMSVGGRMARQPQARTGQDRATVVLGLTPDQALVLSHVHKEAKISLLLRPQEADAGASYSSLEIRSDDVPDLIDRLRGRQD